MGGSKNMNEEAFLHVHCGCHLNSALLLYLLLLFALLNAAVKVTAC